MQWEAAVAVVLGYVAQHLKAIKNIPTAGVQAVLLVVAVGLFALKTPPSQPITAWIMNAIMWGLAAIGTASVSAAVGIAPKTDSK